MAEQPDIATQWGSFDDAKRTRLLAKMTPDQKKQLRQSIEGAGTKQDFTANPKGEGLYRVGSYDFSGGNVTKPEIKIPFSRVQDALKSGYQLHPDEVSRYGKDTTHQGEGPTPWEQTKDFFDYATQPIPDTPLEWDANRTVSGAVRSIPAAVRNVEKLPINVANRIARTLTGMPAGLVQTGEDVYAGRPEGIGSLDPAEMAGHEWEGYQRDVNELGPMAALANVTGDVGAMYAAGKAGEAVKTLPELRRMAEDRYLAPRMGPRHVEVAGVRIPVAVGEADPDSGWGRLQTNLKRRGIKAPQFTELENEQQDAVREAIRRTAQQTTGGNLPRGYPHEPATVMQNAAEKTFDKARPIYRRLDNSLVQVPAAFGEASKITQQAIRRAEKLGVHIDLSPRVVDRTGQAVDLSPSQIKTGLATGQLFEQFPEKQPLGTFMRVRSQLLKMQRSSADAAMRFSIGQEVEGLNRDMHASLRRTPKGRQLLTQWEAADRLWSKAYGLEAVADALRDSTKGTPIRAQAPGLTSIPPRLQGAALVERLNDLAEDGVLKRAFTPQEARNLRQSADILDRIQRTHTGTGEENVSHRGGLGRALGGATLPAVGAGAGFMFGGLHGAEAGAGLGFLVQRFGERALIDVMTRTDGVRAFEAMEAAKTPRQLNTAMTKLRTAARGAAAESTERKSLKELKAEAAQQKPAGATADLHP